MADAQTPAASVAMMMWLPGVVVGTLMIAVKLPSYDVSSGDGIAGIGSTIPRQVIVTAEYGVKELPTMVVVANPLSGVRNM